MGRDFGRDSRHAMLQALLLKAHLRQRGRGHMAYLSYDLFFNFALRHVSHLRDVLADPCRHTLLQLLLDVVLDNLGDVPLQLLHPPVVLRRPMLRGVQLPPGVHELGMQGQRVVLPSFDALLPDQ